MQHGNGRPLGIRKTVRLMVALTILAWATQTLLSQWGYGAPPTAPAERFVPRDENTGAAGAVVRTVTLEVRPEATVVGAEVKLRQVCRWSDRDQPFFTPVADLVIARFRAGDPYRAVGIQEIRATLHDAGVNAAVVNFAGALSCTIARTDVQIDEQEALRQWVNARHGVQPAVPAKPVSVATSTDGDSTQMASAVEHADAVAAPQTQASPEFTATEDVPYRTLRQVLVADLALRLGLAPEQLQVDFSPRDDRALNLSEPHFRFHVTPQRAKSLGPVTWGVLLLADGANDQKMTVQATARAWQDQVVLRSPISTKQVLRDVDVVERRALVDQLDDEPLLTRAQVVGNQAARDMKPGVVLTARMVEPVPLARPGQFVTITIASGSVRIKTVARAMDSGTFGQTIRVKNEATKDIYEVTLTGPQTAEMTPARMTAPGGADLAAASVGGN